MIPTEIAMELLEESADPCAVVERKTRKVLWSNIAWKGFDEAAHALSPGLSLGEGASPETNARSRKIVVWNVAGKSTIEATVAFRPFQLEDRPVAAVMILLPSPAIDLPAIESQADAPDTLTGLAGRSAVEQRIARLEAQPSHARADLAVLFIDLDGFKQINDRWGHATGDQVLATVATRLAGAVRSGDLIARFGGDEFLVLVEGFTHRDELTPLVSRLRKAAEEPIDIAQGSVQISASIGLALSTESSNSLRELIAEADRRMYAEKDPGRLINVVRDES